MEKAKQAVSKIISKDGKHDTVIDEDVRNPVTEKHIHPQQHEEVTTAVDREIHQHHHQTAVQPIKDQETLPTQHTARAVPVQERVVDKGSDEKLQAALAKDQARYKDTETVHDTKKSSSAAAVEGVHTHHHVHQHVQPVIQKDVVQPEVVHTTVPVHEVHHEAPVHHETTMLPAKTMDEFVTSNKGLDASTPRILNKFDGCPTAKDEKLRGDAATKQHIHGN